MDQVRAGLAEGIGRLDALRLGGGVGFAGSEERGEGEDGEEGGGLAGGHLFVPLEMKRFLLVGPGEAGGQEDGAVAEGVAGEGDAGVGRDLLAALLQLAGGTEDPPGSGLPHSCDREEDADGGAFAEEVGELLVGFFSGDERGAGGAGLDRDEGTGLDADHLQVGEGCGGEEGGGGLAQGSGEAADGAAAREDEDRGHQGGERGDLRRSAHTRVPFGGWPTVFGAWGPERTGAQMAMEWRGLQGGRRTAHAAPPAAAVATACSKASASARRC